MSAFARFVTAVRRRKWFVFVCLWTLIFVAIEAYFEETYPESTLRTWQRPSAWLMILAMVGWYYRDSLIRSFPRTRSLDMCVLLIYPLGIFLYLMRSRPRGERLRAMLALIGMWFVLICCAFLGAILGITWADALFL